eukprot:jgi/Orpsp1_1/1176182/evm.model.c7180000056674.1
MDIVMGKCLTISLCNLNIENKKLLVRFVFVFRKYNSYKQYKIISTSNFIFMRRIDYHSDIYSIIFCRKNILPLRKFKNLKFGTYLQIYHINEELEILIARIKYSLKYFTSDEYRHDKWENDIIREGYYEWTIENWKKISEEDESSEFNIADHKWKIKIKKNKKKENNKDGYISCYLYLCDKDTISDNDLIKMNFALYIRNYNDYMCYEFK